MIGIVDYGWGNIRAIANIYKRLNIPAFVASRPGDLGQAKKLVLPGVGAFDEAMSQLNGSGLRDALTRRVREDGIPLLGICVGMQLLARGSEEGELPGLGWIDADVKRLEGSGFQSHTHLPHMGWNDIEIVRSHALLRDLGCNGSFYFLHSFYMACDRRENVLARTDYGVRFDSAVKSGNMYGVQFHPEKSHDGGVKLFKNFAEI